MQLMVPSELSWEETQTYLQLCEKNPTDWDINTGDHRWRLLDRRRREPFPDLGTWEVKNRDKFYHKVMDGVGQQGRKWCKLCERFCERKRHDLKREHQGHLYTNFCLGHNLYFALHDEVTERSARRLCNAPLGRGYDGLLPVSG